MILHDVGFDDLDARTLYAALQLRSQIFVVEQTCVYLDLDGQDERAMHLLGHDDGRLVAYLRAFGPDGSGAAAIGRVVVSAHVRGRGLGRHLMREGMDRVQATWGPVPVAISAQAHLRDFYEGLGYRVIGPGYHEDGIPHLPMRCDEP